MTYKIVYRFNARINITAAKVWYKEQQNGLQKVFNFYKRNHYPPANKS